MNFPALCFVDHIGGDGRLKAEFKPNAILSQLKATMLGTRYHGREATYLIDAAVLRAHVSSGVTLCAKNLFGATSINPDWRKNAHDGFRHNTDGSASYSVFADYLGHKDLGEKTMLFIIDGFYGNDNVDGPPHRKWKMPPFNDAWPNSIFISLDGVAIDSVGFDFLTSEWPDLRISRMPITTCANLPWRMTHLRRLSMILNATASDAAALAYTNIGTVDRQEILAHLGKAHGIELFQT